MTQTRHFLHHLSPVLLSFLWGLWVTWSECSCVLCGADCPGLLVVEGFPEERAWLSRASMFPLGSDSVSVTKGQTEHTLERQPHSELVVLNTSALS